MAEMFLGMSYNPSTHSIQQFFLTPVTISTNKNSLFAFGPSFFYHFLQDQYLAVNLSVAVAHLCLALKLFLALGFDFRIFIEESPYLIIFSLPPLHALTTNFLPPCTCRLGELHFIFDLSIAIILV